MSEGQTGPYDLQAEKALLGSVLIDNGALYQALDCITESDFFGANHRMIFSQMCSLAGANRKIDAVTLAAELDKAGVLEKAGGRLYIVALGNIPLQSAGVAEYARIVKDAAMVRMLLNASRNIAARCVEGTHGPGALIEQAHAQLFDVSERQLGGIGGPQDVKEIVPRLIEDLQKRTGQGLVWGEPSGFSTLDSMTAGWHKGELVILAARPSMGKSALALDFVRKMVRRGKPATVFSLEMNKESLLLRLACRVSDVNSKRVRFGELSDAEFKGLLAALTTIADWPLRIDDTPGLSIEQLQWRIRSEGQRRGPRLVVVDYLQKVHARAENKVQEITRVTDGLQNAARELGRTCEGTILALSQLSRIDNCEEPELHHLRESGSIEQDADVVLFLWDKAKQEPDPHTGAKQIMLKCGKQRNGATGLAPLMWLPARVGFEEAEWDKQEEREA